MKNGFYVPDLAGKVKHIGTAKWIHRVYPISVQKGMVSC
jgi:hypothetical protein